MDTKAEYFGDFKKNAYQKLLGLFYASTDDQGPFLIEDVGHPVIANYDEYRKEVVDDVGKQTEFKNYLPEILFTHMSPTYLFDDDEAKDRIVGDFQKFIANTIGIAFRSSSPDFWDFSAMLELASRHKNIELPDDADRGIYLLAKYYVPWAVNRKNGLFELQYIRYLTDIVLPAMGKFKNSTYLEEAQDIVEKCIWACITNNNSLRTTEQNIESLLSESGEDYGAVMDKVWDQIAARIQTKLLPKLDDDEREKTKTVLMESIPDHLLLPSDAMTVLLSGRGLHNNLITGQISKGYDCSMIPWLYSKALEISIRELWKVFFESNKRSFNADEDGFYKLVPEHPTKGWGLIKSLQARSGMSLEEVVQSSLVNDKAPYGCNFSGAQKYTMLTDLPAGIFPELKGRKDDLIKITSFFHNYRNSFSHTRILDSAAAIDLLGQIYKELIVNIGTVLDTIKKIKRC